MHSIFFNPFITDRKINERIAGLLFKKQSFLTHFNFNYVDKERFGINEEIILPFRSQTQYIHQVKLCILLEIPHLEYLQSIINTSQTFTFLKMLTRCIEKRSELKELTSQTTVSKILFLLLQFKNVT